MKFTHRMSQISESATMKVTAEAGRLKSEGVDVVGFGAGEPDFPTPDNIKNAAVRALDENFTKYTPAGGIAELRTAVCERHRKNFGTAYDPSECIISVGAKHVIFNVVAALIDQGDEVILPVPYWVTFYDVINYHGGKCIAVKTNQSEGFRLTANNLEQAITSKTKLLIINSPNNPSGAVISKNEFERIYALAVAKDITLLTDECYCQLVYDSEPFSIASLKDAQSNVVVAGSVSKTYAMTGWRIGYTLAPQPLIRTINKLQSHSTSNPTSIAQKAAVEALNGPQDSIQSMLSEYRHRRDYTVSALNDIPGITCEMPGGAFYAYPNIQNLLGKNGLESPMDFVTALLKEAHVAVVPGEAFGTTEHFRLSYATSMHDLERGIQRIRDFVKNRF